MAMAAGTAEGEPMMDINTTPLIDVMLVLLIMFIITLPPQTHAVKLDLPVNQPNQPKPPIDPVKNSITTNAAGQIFWNGTPTDLVTLRQYIDLTKNMDPEPELHLQPDQNTRYEVIDDILATVKKSQVEKFGFVGNEAYSGVF
jgi:biopolymer transport protein ExbD